MHKVLPKRSEVDRIALEFRRNNYEQLQGESPYFRVAGLYSDRTDAKLSADGWIELPCEDCSTIIRVAIENEMEGPYPVAHDDDHGAEFDSDLAWCKRCAPAYAPAVAR